MGFITWIVLLISATGALTCAENAYADAPIYLQVSQSTREALGQVLMEYWNQHPELQQQIYDTIQSSQNAIATSLVDKNPFMTALIGAYGFKDPAHPSQVLKPVLVSMVPAHSVQVRGTLKDIQVVPASNGKWDVYFNFASAKATIPQVQIGFTSADSKTGEPDPALFQPFKAAQNPNSKTPGEIQGISGTLEFSDAVAHAQIELPEKGSDIRFTDFSFNPGTIHSNMTLPNSSSGTSTVNLVLPTGPITSPGTQAPVTHVISINPQQLSYINQKISSGVTDALKDSQFQSEISAKTDSGIQEEFEDFRKSAIADLSTQPRNSYFQSAFSDLFTGASTTPLSAGTPSDPDLKKELLEIIDRRIGFLKSPHDPMTMEEQDSVNILTGILKAIYGHPDQKSLALVLGLSESDLKRISDQLNAKDGLSLPDLLTLSKKAEILIKQSGKTKTLSHSPIFETLESLTQIDLSLTVTQTMVARLDENDTRLREFRLALLLNANSLLNRATLPAQACGQPPSPVLVGSEAEALSFNLQTANSILATMFQQGSLGRMTKGLGYDIISAPTLSPVPGKPNQLVLNAKLKPELSFTPMGLIRRFVSGRQDSLSLIIQVDPVTDPATNQQSLKISIPEIKKFDERLTPRDLLNPVGTVLSLLLNPFNITTRTAANTALNNHPESSSWQVPVPDGLNLTGMSVAQDGWVQFSAQGIPSMPSMGATSDGGKAIP